MLATHDAPSRHEAIDGKSARPPLAPEHRSLQVCWATTWSEVREAQRLRYRVFAQEIGARVPSGQHGLDADEFDAFCDHLLVRDGTDGPVVGTYRVLLPDQARAAGGLYSDDEFDLSALDPLRPTLAEVGRACVDARFRSGGVITALWAALADYMAERDIDWMMGCCSLPLQPSSQAPAALWRQLSRSHAAGEPWRAWPRTPLPLEAIDNAAPPEVPALLKGYLRLGAKVLGPPAWDPAFGCADLPVLLQYSSLPLRFRRRIATPATGA